MSNYDYIAYEFCEMCLAQKESFTKMGVRLDQAQGWFPKSKKGEKTTVVSCKNCGLIFCQPVPIPINIEHHYGQAPTEYWKNQQVVESQDNSLDAVESEIRKHIQPESSYLLDVGSGMGNDLNAAKKMGFKVLGVEPSSNFRTASIQKYGFKEDEIIHCTFEQFSLKKESFDFITFGAVLEHLPHPGLALKKAIELLKPGGIIQVQVPNARWLTARMINFIYRFTAGGFVCNLSPLHAPFHLFEFHEQSFKHFASQNKLDIVLLQYDICDTMLPSSLNWIIKPLMKATNSGMELTILYRKQ